MASGNFNRLLQPLLGIEGGVANRPLKADPGGLTNKGVTHAVYDAYREGKGLPLQSVTLMTGGEAVDIYQAQYWTPIRGNDLPSGLDWAVFDFAVNSGPSEAVKVLQRVLGVVVDGVIGLGTLQALGQASLPSVIERYCDARLAFMKTLRNWAANKNGWMARVDHVKTTALDMADPATPTTAPVLPATPLPESATAKAPPVAQAQLKTPEGIGLTCAAAGAGGTQLKALAETVQVHVGMDTLLGRLAFVVFLILMLLGGGLIGYSYIGRIREKGGLGGLVSSVLKGESP